MLGWWRQCNAVGGLQRDKWGSGKRVKGSCDEGVMWKIPGL